jgi:hypothetical protein
MKTKTQKTRIEIKKRINHQKSVSSNSTKMIHKETKYKLVTAMKSSLTVTKPFHRLQFYDVICGRHRGACDNIGNRRFRIIVALSVETYINAPTRAHKSTVIRDIVDTIHNCGGRFVQRCKSRNASTWEELDEKQIHDKVGHALRDMSTCVEEKTDMTTLLCPNHSTLAMVSSRFTSQPRIGNITPPCPMVISNIPTDVSNHCHTINHDDDDWTFSFDDDFDDLTTYTSPSITSLSPSLLYIEETSYDYDINGNDGEKRLQRENSINSLAMASSILCL